MQVTRDGEETWSFNLNFLELMPEQHFALNKLLPQGKEFIDSEMKETIKGKYIEIWEKDFS